MTIRISACTYLLGMLLGLGGAGLKLSRRRWLKSIGNLYTTMVRAVPELLLVILLYYTGTSAVRNLLIGLGLVQDFQVNAFLAAVVALGFVQGAYMTEVFRGAILSVPPGQSEAAQALGLRPGQRFRLVIFPQMLRFALPGLGNLWLVVLKDSSLISVVGFTELTGAGQIAAGSTKRYFFFYLVTGAVFLMLTVVSTIVLRWIERRSTRGQAAA